MQKNANLNLHVKTKKLSCYHKQERAITCILPMQEKETITISWLSNDSILPIRLAQEDAKECTTQKSHPTPRIFQIQSR